MMNRALFSAALIASLGGFLFGFDTAVISGTNDWLREVFVLSEAWLGFTVASALVGTILGALVMGKPADALGRRTTLMLIGVLYFVSALGCGIAWDWYSLLFFRFLGGIGVGGASVVAPTYIAEISPSRLRGRLVALTQFNIVFGILMAFVSNYVISQLALGDAEWRWMFGVEAAPAAIFFALLFLTPRSPRWLVAQGNSAEAAAVLNKVGTDTGDVAAEIAEIEKSLSHEENVLREPFSFTKYRVPIMLAVAIAAFNQLSGINAVLYYAPNVFKMTGAGAEAALFQSVIIGLTNLVFTMAALAIIDHFGRKKLMIVGSLGYIVSLATVAASFYTYGTDFSEAGGMVVLGALMLFIASHAFGQGAVIWVFISEIFPNKVRARGQALGSFTHWFMAALISWTFPYIAALNAGHIFAFYTVMMVLQLVWVLTLMPETKGVPLEQIQKRMGIA
jgi:sugar porter (SP) family MFS transporter